MDTTEAAFEAHAELEGEALRQEQERRRDRTGQKAVEVIKPGIDISGFGARDGGDEGTNEASPLLPGAEELDRQPTWQEEFVGVPWYRKPSIFWILGPFFLMACAFGGIITPKLNLILELICREYMDERQMWDPGFTMIPVDFKSGDNDQCRIPEVQSRVAQFNLWGSLIAGLLSAFTSPILGALSDRYGRKKVLIVTSFGTIAGEAITICAATYPETFPVRLLWLGFAIDGLTGSFIVAMAIANSYASDCTPPARRGVAFASFHGCLFTGMAIGPIVAGYIVEATGKIVVIFWVLLGVHIFFITFVTLFAPESLSMRRQLAAREKHAKKLLKQDPNLDWINQLRIFNLVEQLKVFAPRGPGSSPALRRNLFFLAAVDTIVFGVAMGSISIVVIYTNFMFGWKTFESGRFITIVNTSRVFCLLVVLPLATRLVRGKPEPGAKQRNTGCDLFDLTIIRIAVLFDTLGYLGFTLSRSGTMMALSGVIAAVGGMASPTLQSAMTKHVPPDQTGALLGASGLLHALSRVFAPTIFNAIYAATVGSFPQAVFVCLSSTFGLAFLISWCLKPKVYFNEAEAARALNDPDLAHQDQSDGDNTKPTYARRTGRFGSIGAYLGLASGS